MSKVIAAIAAIVVVSLCVLGYLLIGQSRTSAGLRSAYGETEKAEPALPEVPPKIASAAEPKPVGEVVSFGLVVPPPRKMEVAQDAWTILAVDELSGNRIDEFYGFVLSGTDRVISLNRAVKSDGAGVLTIPVPDAEECAIRIFASGYVPKTIMATSTSFTYEVRLSQGARIDGYIVAAEPVPNVRICAEPVVFANSTELAAAERSEFSVGEFSNRCSLEKVALDDALPQGQVGRIEGNEFSITGLVPGPYAVLIYAPGYRLEPDTWPPALVHAPAGSLEIRLVKSALLTVRVVDESGSPVANARLNLDMIDRPGAMFFPPIMVDDGTYVFGADGAIPDGGYRVLVASKSYYFERSDPVRVTGSIADPETVIVTLSKCPSLAIEARDGVGRLVPPAEVALLGTRDLHSAMKPYVSNAMPPEIEISYEADRIVVSSPRKEMQVTDLLFSARRLGEALIHWEPRRSHFDQRVIEFPGARTSRIDVLSDATSTAALLIHRRIVSAAGSDDILVFDSRAPALRDFGIRVIQEEIVEASRRAIYRVELYEHGSPVPWTWTGRLDEAGAAIHLHR